MTLRNEIFEGLGAAKASMDLVKGVRGDPRDDYYREIARAAKRRNQQEDAIDQQNRDPVTGAYRIPPIAGTNTPGTPTTGTPMPGMSGAYSDPILNPPVRPMPVGRRGGLIPRYQYGGSVQHFEYGGTPEDDQSEADLVLRSILARDHEEMARRGRGLRSMSGASDTINRALIPEAPNDDAYLSTRSATQPPAADTDDAYLSTDRARDRSSYQDVFNRELRPDRGSPLGDEDTARIRATTPAKKTSRYQDWKELGDSEESRNARESQDDWRARMADRKRGRLGAKIARDEATPNLFDELTPEEKIKLRERRDEIDKVLLSTEPPDVVYPQRQEELRALNTRPPVPASTQNLPTKPTAPRPGEAAAATAGPQMSTPVDPDLLKPKPAPAPAPTAKPRAMLPNADMLNKIIQPGPYDTDMLPFDRAPAPEPQPPPPPPNARGGDTTGPPTTGNSGPTGTSASPAPPAGATDPAAANRALPREQRTTAFDPRFETGAGYVDASGRDTRAMDTGAPPPAGGGGRDQALGTPSSGMTGGQADQGLSSNSVADVSKVVSGALSYGRSSGGDGSFVGHKAISKEAFDQLIAQNNQGGRLSEGNAWLAGMTRAYQMALMFGMTDKANAMAYGIIQQANMIASSYGHAAVDALRRGDLATAAKYTEGGLDHIPDSMNHSVSADGRNWVTTDPRTGKVTGQIPIDGRWVLKAALGLQNGSLMWQTLHASAAQLNKDKDPVGRQLRHQLTIKQMEMLDERMRRSKAGGTKGGVSPLAASTLDLVGAGPSSQQSGRGDQQSQLDRDEATDLALAFSNPGGYDEREQ